MNNGNAYFSIDLNEFPKIQEKLEKLSITEKDRTSLLKSLGRLIIQQTQKRFETKIGPDNKPWANWSASYKLTRHNGQSILENTGHLVNSFTSYVSGSLVTVKSTEPYSATHNYGDNRAIRRKTKNGKQSKLFNRNIPKREFLGINSEDKEEITNTIINYIDKKYEHI